MLVLVQVLVIVVVLMVVLMTVTPFDSVSEDEERGSVDALDVAIPGLLPRSRRPPTDGQPIGGWTKSTVCGSISEFKFER